MPIRNQIVALMVSVGMLVLIIELVRRRKLREEYSWLWLLTVSTILLLSVWFGLLKWITHLMGALVPSSTIFYVGFCLFDLYQPPLLCRHLKVDAPEH